MSRPSASPGFAAGADLVLPLRQALALRAGRSVRSSMTKKHWRSSNFSRNVLQRAYRAAG
jgi:hypothetical protein